MTEESINKAIATACGKTYHKPTEQEIASGSYYQYEPNYFRSLDAMHEAEKCAPMGYADMVRMVVARGSSVQPSHLCDQYLIHATATQRAEAFLRTIGKWVD